MECEIIKNKKGGVAKSVRLRIFVHEE